MGSSVTKLCFLCASEEERAISNNDSSDPGYLVPTGSMATTGRINDKTNMPNLTVSSSDGKPAWCNEEQLSLLRDNWDNLITQGCPNFFLLVWQRTTRRSPTLNEIIVQVTGESDRDAFLKRRLAVNNAIAAFCRRQVFENHQSEKTVAVESHQLGARHALLTKKGFKPTFVDLWVSSLVDTVVVLECNGDMVERLQSAWHTLGLFICHHMHKGYADGMLVLNKKKLSGCSKSEMSNAQ